MIISNKKTKYNLLENLECNPAREKTEVEVWKDDKNIYFDFECDTYKKDYVCVGEKYNDPLYNGDVVEVFITLGRLDKYLELETNPKGLNYAVLVENADGFGEITLTQIDTCPYTSVVKKKGKDWTTKMTISLQTLKELGFDSNNAYINLFRHSYFPDGKHEYYAYNPTTLRNFHIVSYFVKLTLKD